MGVYSPSCPLCPPRLEYTLERINTPFRKKRGRPRGVLSGHLFSTSVRPVWSGLWHYRRTMESVTMPFHRSLPVLPLIAPPLRAKFLGASGRWSRSQPHSCLAVRLLWCRAIVLCGMDSQPGAGGLTEGPYRAWHTTATFWPSCAWRYPPVRSHAAPCIPAIGLTDRGAGNRAWI